MKFIKLCLFSILFISSGVFAADITIYYSPSCPHCHHARDFIENKLIYEYDSISVNEVNVMSIDNRDVFFAAIKKCKYDTGGVPVMVIGNKCFQGYADNMQEDIRLAVEQDMTENQKKQASINRKEIETNEVQFLAEHQARKSAISDVDNKKKVNDSNYIWFYLILVGIVIIGIFVLKRTIKK